MTIYALWNNINRFENRRFEISALSFLLSIVPASLAVSIASFSGIEFPLALVLFLSALTITFILAMVPLKLLLLSGIVSFIANMITILYGLIAHWNMLKHYMEFL